jgi:hypothetical protein
MFIIIMILLFQMNIGVFTQGIFDPWTFTQSSCSGSNQWTIWFDSSDPNIEQGEFEVTNYLLQHFPVFICPAAIAIEVNRTNYFYFLN